mmetsp:Transcript_23822/g.21164  ORF Transcript_23822/g.21164 Transcript_23822/m.21164 type:complete len:89 (+) Transcript_23822:750-1016(+)
MFNNRSMDYSQNIDSQDEIIISKEIDNLKIKYKMKKRENLVLPQQISNTSSMNELGSKVRTEYMRENRSFATKESILSSKRFGTSIQK